MRRCIHRRPASALLALLGRHPATPVASALVRVELRRAVARSAGTARPDARTEAVLRRLDLVALDDPLLDAAAGIGAPGLRSLDAIHLASADLVRDELAAVVTYDVRLAAAARDLGLGVAAPA
ncbi:MAG: PIN domain-containing protein [Thermoleophilia bacterium]|nr:PIN domain-containing protein [Thermoleophilia bacterium]